MHPTPDTPHPSRTAPRCIDCQHLDARPDDRHMHCNHPSAPVDVVTGKPMTRVDAMRTDRSSSVLYASRVVPCGQIGSLFVLRDRVTDVPERLGKLGQSGPHLVLHDVGENVDSTGLNERAEQLGVSLGVTLAQ